jgi:peroxiredoxin Q/BCP
MTSLTLRRVFPWALLLVAPFVGGTASADDEYQKMIYVRVGDLAPNIQLQDDQGGSWKLSRHVGKKNIVVFFYLGDFMPACTKHASAYRDTLGRLAASGAEVIGISGDSVATHAKFKEVNRLNFSLLADVDGEVTKAYGVGISGSSTTKVKDARGKTTSYQRNITASRCTWVIGKDGTVIYKNTSPQPVEDAKQVLAFLEKTAAEAKRK